MLEIDDLERFAVQLDAHADLDICCRCHIGYDVYSLKNLYNGIRGFVLKKEGVKSFFGKKLAATR